MQKSPLKPDEFTMSDSKAISLADYRIFGW